MEKKHKIYLFAVVFSAALLFSLPFFYYFGRSISYNPVVGLFLLPAGVSCGDGICTEIENDPNSPFYCPADCGTTTPSDYSIFFEENGGAPYVTQNSIIEFKVNYDGEEITVDRTCLFNINGELTAEGLNLNNNAETIPCGIERRVDTFSVDHDGELIEVNFALFRNEDYPCAICERTVHALRKENVEEIAIPDGSIISLLLVFLGLVLIIKTEKNKGF